MQNTKSVTALQICIVLLPNATERCQTITNDNER